MNLKENTELQSGKYRIIRVLGQGGFGITYLAENVFFNKIVAIKEFFPKSFCGRDNTSHLTLGTANNAETVEKLLNRFMKEARNIAKLDHPGIVKIQDIFRENNTAYYVMDYIEGENLNELVKRNGPLSEEKAVEYIKKVGEALSYIHSKNMTHFDVKPANIMVRKSDDRPILIDFGLSKQYDASGDATSTMLNGVSQGYSPIELYNPGSLTEFSPQTDVYSLAATLLFLLTGTTPPSASDIAMNGLTLPETISQDLREIIMSFMKTKRTERPKELILQQTSDKHLEKKYNELESQQNEVQENEETSFVGDSHTTDQILEDTGFEEYSSQNNKKNFVNWICGLSKLNNVESIPIEKKLIFGICRFGLILAALFFPIGGWLILVTCYRYIPESLQRLIIPEYLDEYDDGYYASKGKSIFIISCLCLSPLFWIGLILYS